MHRYTQTASEKREKRKEKREKRKELFRKGNKNNALRNDKGGRSPLFLQ